MSDIARRVQEPQRVDVGDCVDEELALTEYQELTDAEATERYNAKRRFYAVLPELHEGDVAKVRAR